MFFFVSEARRDSVDAAVGLDGGGRRGRGEGERKEEVEGGGGTGPGGGRGTMIREKGGREGGKYRGGGGRVRRTNGLEAADWGGRGEGCLEREVLGLLKDRNWEEALQVFVFGVVSVFFFVQKCWGF